MDAHSRGPKSYLLSYDPITFLSYLETIRSSSVNNPKTPGAAKQLTSNTWLMTDAANIMFTAARQRCYAMRPRAAEAAPSREDREMDEAWNIMAEMEGLTPAPAAGRDPALDEADGWKPWMPRGMVPILEELPKWRILSDVLDEIEHTMINQPAPPRKSNDIPQHIIFTDTLYPFRTEAPGSNITLIMASDQRTCALLREFLSTKHIHPSTPGRHMLETRLQTYLFWKNGLLSTEQNPSKSEAPGGRPPTEGQVSEALKKKDASRNAAYMKRRRVRGGAPTGTGDRADNTSATRESSVARALEVDSEDLADLCDPIFCFSTVLSGLIVCLVMLVNRLSNLWISQMIPLSRYHLKSVPWRVSRQKLISRLLRFRRYLLKRRNHSPARLTKHTLSPNTVLYPPKR